MPRRYATVRNATPGDLAAAIETAPETGLKSTTYTITSSAGDDIAFSVGGLAALSTPATDDAVADASTLAALWLATPAYAALVSAPSRVIDNEDGTFTVIFLDQLSHVFADSSTGANAVAESATGGELTLLSVEVGANDPLPFVGDGAPFAVVEYTADELRVRRLLVDWIDWGALDSGTQAEASKFIAARDLELGEQLQGAVLIAGWESVAINGATPIEFLMLQQLNTSYAATAANNGGLYLAKELIARIPDSIMSPAQKSTYTDAINYHTLIKWVRPVDPSPTLPPQVIEMSADFTFAVYTPAYIVDVSGGDVVMTLPPLAEAGVLPYWYTPIKVIGAGPNTLTIAAHAGETIDGSATLVIAVDQRVELGGAASEWKNLV